MGKIKAHELRTKSKSDLLSQLQELKNELVMVRIECIADIHLQTVVLLILLLCVILYLHIPSLFSYLFTLFLLWLGFLCPFETHVLTYVSPFIASLKIRNDNIFPFCLDYS